MLQRKPQRNATYRRVFRRNLQMEIFERRDLLNTDWQNPFDARDTNTDGFISPIDALLVINTLNQSGSRVLSGMSTPDEAMFDVSGDNFVSPIDVLLVVNRLNAEGSGAVPGVIAESLAQAQTENTIPINAGLSSGTRKVFLDFQTYLTPSSATVASTDLLSVYVVDSAGTSTLLDRGELGTSVFSLSHNDSEIVPGLSTWNGSTLSVDVSILGDRAEAKLKLQLLNGDGKQRSMFKLTGVRYESDATGTVSDIEVSQPLRVAAGQQLDTSLFSNGGNLRLDVSNTRYQSTSNEYAADLVIQNIGDAVGRQVVVALSGLPTGAQVLNASGTTPSGQPYINFESAMFSGGLGKYAQSLTIPVQIHNPNNQPLVLQPTILVGAPNAAPSLAPLGTVNVTPGQQVTVALNGSDTNGDKLTYTLSNMTSGPHSMLLGNKLTIAPTPTEIGTYDLNVIVSDGALTASQPLRINVNSDTNTNTRVSGRVLDVDGTPLVGVVVEIGAVQALTQSDGRFLIDLGTTALLTDTIKIRGEQITGAVTYPFIAEKLPLLLSREVYVGFNNVIDRPIYLPKLDMVNGKTIDPTKTTVVTTAAIPDAKVTVAAGTLMNQQNTPFTGQLSITEVPLERTPAAIPEGLFPDLVVTIQPGEMVFTVPTPISLPNRTGRLPGTILDLWSINPTTGQFEIVGQSRVSSDGLTVDTISGGIRNSSWHFVCPPIIGSTNNVSNGDNGCNECQAKKPAKSDVMLHSGALVESHDLPSYQSLGASRTLSLVYDSERADPRPIFHVGFDSLALWDDFRMGAQIEMNVGATTIRSQGLESPLFPFAVGENVWKVPQEQTSASGAIQMDLADVPSGIYEYTASSKLVFGTLVVFSSFYEKQYLHINGRDSVFGAGWGIKGLKEAILNYDVTSAFGASTFVSDVLLVDGNGDENRFAGGNRDSNFFLSPPGDFSELSYDSVLRQLTHRMVDGSVYKYLPVLTPPGQRPSKLQLVSMVDRNGNETRFEYSNGLGITSIIDPVGLTTSFEYSRQRVTRIIDPAGRVTNLTYQGDNLTTVIDPDSSQTAWQYDALSHMVGETTKRGFEQQATFDLAGRATHATREDGTEVSFNTLANRGVYPANQTTNVSDPPLALPFSNGASRYRDGNGNVSEFILDARGQATAQRDSIATGGTTSRNSDNLVTRKLDARLHSVEYVYDERGNVVEIKDDIVLSDDLSNPTITWRGTVSNDWNTPANWVENRLPNASDDVLISDLGSANPILISNLIVQVSRLFSTRPLQLNNGTLKLTGSSRLSAGLLLLSRSTLEVRGSNARLLTIGELSSDSSTILVIGGATLNASQYRVSGGFSGQNFVRSEGANSEIVFEQQSDDSFQSRGATFNAVSQGRIRFPGLTDVQFPGTLGAAGGGVIELNGVVSASSVLFSASSLGRIEARNLATVTDGSISIYDTGVFPYAQLSNVDGTSISAESGAKITIAVPSYRLSATTSLLRARGVGSQLNFPNLVSFVDETAAESNYARVNAAMDGVVSLPLISATSSVQFAAESNGTIAVPLLTSVKNGLVEVSGNAQFPFGQLANIDSSSITAADGAKISLPLIASYVMPTSFAAFVARGIGTELRFPELGSITEPVLNRNNQLNVSASDSGVIEIPKLKLADGAYFSVTTSGSILAPQLTTVSNGRIIVTGNGQFPVGQLLNIDGSGISITGGAKATFSGITSYKLPFIVSTIEVRGAGSELRFPELVAFTDDDQSFSLNVVGFQAVDGGLLSAPKLSALVKFGPNVTSSGSGSSVELPLIVVTDENQFSVSDGGRIVAPLLTSVRNGAITINGNGQFPISQLTNIDGSNITAGAGAKLSFPLITRFKMAPIVSTFSANGAGAELHFPELVEILINETTSGGSINTQAFNGGILTLAKFASPRKAAPQVTAIGNGSRVELPLVSATDGNTFTVNDGGQVVAPLLTSVKNGLISITGNGQFPISQLTNIDGSNITAGAGAKLSFPLITRFKMAPSVSTFSANGAGAELHFPELITILVNETTSGGSVNTQAFNGGILTLAKFASPLKAAPQVLATGNGSRVELPLVTATDGNIFTVNNGGQVVAPLLTSVKNGVISVDGIAGKFPASQLTNIDDSGVTASAGANITFTGLQSLQASGSGTAILRATGSGSLIQFHQLVTVIGKLNTPTALQFVAENSANVNLPAAVNVRDVTLRATGAGSVIRVPAMTNAVNVSILEQQGGLVNGPG